MWPVLLGGFFGLLTLLTKAAIDAGGRTHRARNAIAADLELLAKSRELLGDLASVEDLIDRIDRQLIQYAVSDLAPSTTDKQRPKVERRQAVTRAADLLTIGAVLLATGLLSGISARLIGWTPDLNNDLVSWVSAGASAVIGVAIPLLSFRVARQRRALTLEQWRAEQKLREAE